MEPVERMMNLTKCLPKGDIVLAQRFIDSRGFESLQELVDSAIYKVRKHKARKDEEGGVPPKQEYLDVDLTELSNLKAEVDVYLTQLEVPSNEWGEDIEEEYYGEEY